MLEPPKGHGAIPAAGSPGQTQESKGWEQSWQWDLCPCHGVCSEPEPVLWHQCWDATGDAASVRVVAGAGIQLEAAWSSPSLAKSAEFHWLQVAFHFINWQKYKCLFFFPVLAILGRNGLPAPWLFMEQIIAPGWWFFRPNPAFTFPFWVSG